MYYNCTTDIYIDFYLSTSNKELHDCLPVESLVASCINALDGREIDLEKMFKDIFIQKGMVDHFTTIRNQVAQNGVKFVEIMKNADLDR
jgi:hypothetical protein